MAKRHIEDFNPWPAFVDMFASVIMVVLMFMLVLIVNVAFYAQFKFKLSYVAAVPVDHILTEKEIIENTVNKTIVKGKDGDIVEDEKRDLLTVGVDLTKKDQKTTRQENITHLDWMVVQYQSDEIILDAPTIKEVEAFTEQAKQKFPEHNVSIFTSEPKGQTSATVSRQISLSRALNIRNLIRKLDYNRDDVTVKLREEVPVDKKVEHSAGYVVIIINQKR